MKTGIWILTFSFLICSIFASCKKRNQDIETLQNIVEQINAKGDTEFKIQLKVTKPDGNPIYLPNKKVTAEGDITIQKSKKNQMIEIDQFGSSKEGFWKAGEYKVEVIEGGDVVFITSFNIL